MIEQEHLAHMKGILVGAGVILGMLLIGLLFGELTIGWKDQGELRLNSPLLTLIDKEISWKPGTDSESRVYFIRGKFGEDRLAIYAAVLPIEGVTNALAEPYAIRVRISECYDWSEVHGKVIEVLQELVGKKKSEMEEGEEETPAVTEDPATKTSQKGAV